MKTALSLRSECPVLQQLVDHGAMPAGLRFVRRKGPPMRLAATDNAVAVLVERLRKWVVSELGPGSQQLGERPEAIKSWLAPD